MYYYLLLLAVRLIITSSAYTSLPCHRLQAKQQLPQLQQCKRDNGHPLSSVYNDSTGYPAPNNLYKRRHLLLTSVFTGSALIPFPLQSIAETSTNEGVVSIAELASLLKPIPTFAIVDPRGVPYFVVGEDAKLTSYFFLSYGEAQRILNVAISSSEKAIQAARARVKNSNGLLTKEDEEEISTNPWKTAHITTVPMDVAVSLASKGKLAGAYFRLAPSESDIEDALAIDGSEDLPEGKTPLFYIEDMTIIDGDKIVSPLYFQKKQLVTEWKRQQQRQPYGAKDKFFLPEVKVTELFATLTEMLRPGGTNNELKTLLFVAPKDSKIKAQQILSVEKEPFQLGERIIVL